MLPTGDIVFKFLSLWGTFLLQITTPKKSQRNTAFNQPSRKKVIMTTVSKTIRTFSRDQISQLNFITIIKYDHQKKLGGGGKGIYLITLR